MVIETHLNNRVLGAILLAGLLALSGLAAPAAAGGAASEVPASGRQTAIGTFPANALSCVRTYVSPGVRQFFVETTPEMDFARKMAKLETHFDDVNRLADRCGFAATERGGQQITALLIALGMKEWSEGRLKEEFSVSRDQLSTMMSEIPAEDQAKLGAIIDGPGMPDSTKEVLPATMKRAKATLGVEGERAYFLLYLYMRSAAKLAYFE